MQVGIDVTCMHTNFGGRGFFGFGDNITFQIWPNCRWGYGPKTETALGGVSLAPNIISTVKMSFITSSLKDQGNALRVAPLNILGLAS